LACIWGTYWVHIADSTRYVLVLDNLVGNLVGNLVDNLVGNLVGILRGLGCIVLVLDIRRREVVL